MSDNKLKLTAKELKTIIAEEASKYKKKLDLQKQKDSILSQLNELNDKK